MPAYKDTNGTYFVSFYYEDFRGVKKRKMKRGFARRRDALDWERRFLLQSTADLSMKFSDFVEIYRNDKQMRICESTWESKNNMIDLKILPYFKDRPINAIEPKDIIAWQNEIMNLTKPNGEPYSTTYGSRVGRAGYRHRDLQLQRIHAKGNPHPQHAQGKGGRHHHFPDF